VRERMSGFAEMIKHGLLSDREYLTRLLNLEYQVSSGKPFSLTDKYNSATNPNATASPCKRVAPRMPGFYQTILSELSFDRSRGYPVWIDVA